MRKRFNTTNSFLDLLFNTLLGFFMLFAIALMMVNPPAKNGDIDLKAEILVTMEWPKGGKDDVDIFFMTPDKEVVFYGHQNGKSASLDRDDQGARNDTFLLSDGTRQVIEDNWEHITVRRAMAGKYTVNIYMFSKRDKTPTPVTVKIEKLNPYQLLYATTIELKRDRQEETVLTFKLDSNGKVISKSNAPVRIVRQIGE